MIAFLAAAWSNPLVRKCAIYAGIGIAVLYGFRLWGNAQWAKGVDSGRKAAVQSLEKAKVEEWKQKDREYKATGEKLAGDRRVLDAQVLELKTARQAFNDSLSRKLNQIEIKRGENNARVNSIPDSLLDASIRDVSRELAGGAAQ